MLMQIRHETRYQYDHGADYVIQQLRLTPRSDPGQKVLRWRIQSPGRRRSAADAYGNTMHTLTLVRPEPEIRIQVDGVVETEADLQALPNVGLHPYAFLAQTPLTRVTAEVEEFARGLFDQGVAILDGLYELMCGVHRHVAYTPGATGASTCAPEVLRLARGVCQDQAHLFIACCRALHVPARYVSGYLYEPRREHAASHAWADAWAQDLGWVSFDVTHGRLATADLCRLAVGRDYLDACPIRGVRRGGGAEAMEVSVQVAAIER
jgi:transglutaminase-like putative cysteine protease